MKKRLCAYFFLIALGWLAYSCIKENDLTFGQIQIDDHFSYDVPIPMVDARLTLADLLKKIPGQNIIADENGLLKVVYQHEFDYKFPEYVDLPNQSYNLSLPSSIPIVPALITTDSLVIPCPAFTANLNIDGEDIQRIDSAKLRALTYHITLVTEIQHKGNIRLSCPNLLDSSGQPLTILLPLPGVSAGQTSQTVNIPDVNLTNYDLKLDNFDSENLHVIQFDCSITLFKDANITQNYMAGANLTFNMKNIEPEWIYGYFGQQTFDLEENSFELPVFNKFGMDSLNVEKIYANFVISNGLGFPVKLDGQIILQTNESGEPSEPFRFNQILNHRQNPSEAPATTILRDSLQSIHLQKLPQSVRYSASALTNPTADPTMSNFVSSNSSFKLAVNGEIPMRLRISRLTVSDTINFPGLPTNMNIEGIEFFTLRANIHNAFPLNAQISMHFLNEKHEKIDEVSLTKIDAASVNPVDGHVTAPTATRVEIQLTQQQIRHLIDTRYFLINGVASTTNHEAGTLIGIYENSENEGFMKVMIGCRIKVSGKIFDNLNDFMDEAEKNETSK